MSEDKKPEHSKLTIENIANGVARELFDRELDEVLENIHDPNMEKMATRKITLEVTFHPTKDPGMANITVGCKSKLAGVLPADGVIFMTNKGKRPEAFNYNYRQDALPFDAVPKPTPINAKQQGEK